MNSQISCQACGAILDRAELVDRKLSHCVSCGEKLDSALFNDLKLTGLDFPIRVPPLDSRIEIIEAANDRLMLSIPPGGKRSRSLGCFALIWTSISVVVLVAMLFVVMQEKQRFPVAAALIPGGFVLIGIVMTVIWIRMKFTRGYLFLEPERAVMQTILFNKKKNAEVQLNESSRAKLVESYSENDVPVYRIELGGFGKTISFGTAWDRPAKDWYVEAVNSFLAWHHNNYPSNSIEGDANTESNPSDREAKIVQNCPACEQRTELITEAGSSVSTGDCRCQQCGCRLIVDAGKISEALPLQLISPDELRADTPFQIEKTGVKEWLLTVKMNQSKDAATGGGCLLVIGIMWEGFVLFWSWGAAQAPGFFKYVMLCFSLPFHVVGIAMLALGLYAFFGRFRLLLGRDESWGRWSLGPIRYTKRFRAESVTEVKLVHGALLKSAKNRSRNDRASSQSEEFSCILMAAGKKIPVTHGNSSEESRLAAGLVRYCLDDLGIRLQDD